VQEHAGHKSGTYASRRSARVGGGQRLKRRASGLSPTAQWTADDDAQGADDDAAEQ